ncbi:MAG TPA: hypothetical protein VGG78_04655 [Gemmatimonadaceae bacterium]
MTNSTQDATRDVARTVAVRVPGITAWFWIVKILTTGAGESTSDYMGRHLPHALVAGVGVVVLAGSLVLQIRMRRYVAWTYWLAVSVVAIFGTMFADVVHAAGVGYTGTTLVFAAVLAAIFYAWHRSEGTLSIHSITTHRRECFYWATVITTFALGTAAGDMTATTFGWGYLTSGIVFAIAIAMVGVVHWLVQRGRPADRGAAGTAPVLAFWLAYILTRPLGASFADWMGEPRAKGGLEWGGGTVSIALWIVIAILVAWIAVSRVDVQADEPIGG